MTDTPRTEEELLTIFEDGQIGTISAQDMRDFIVSVTPVHFVATITSGQMIGASGLYESLNLDAPSEDSLGWLNPDPFDATDWYGFTAAAGASLLLTPGFYRWATSMAFLGDVELDADVLVKRDAGFDSLVDPGAVGGDGFSGSYQYDWTRTPTPDNVIFSSGFYRVPAGSDPQPLGVVATIPDGARELAGGGLRVTRMGTE